MTIEKWIRITDFILWVIIVIFILKFLNSLYEFRKFLKSRPNKRILKDIFKNETVGKGEDKKVVKWWAKILLLISFFIMFLFIEEWVRTRYKKNDDNDSQPDCE